MGYQHASKRNTIILPSVRYPPSPPNVAYQNLRASAYRSRRFTLEYENLIRWFLAHGASPEAPISLLFRTPIMLAGHFVPLSVMQLMCVHVSFLENVLQCAAESSTEGWLEIMEFSLDQGADINDVKWQHHRFTDECFE